jgi:oxygen-independent coproporphyrinogen-3 oxidase
MMRVGVYVQVPFCQTKCTYCNFHTGVVSSARFGPYADAVCGEIREYRRHYGGSAIVLPQTFEAAVVDTVYM